MRSLMLEERFRQVVKRISDLEVEVQTKEFILRKEESENADLRSKIEEVKKQMKILERDVATAETDHSRFSISLENVVRSREHMETLLSVRRPELAEASRQLSRALQDSEEHLRIIDQRRVDEVMAMNRISQYLAHVATGNPNITEHVLSIPIEDFMEEIQPAHCIAEKDSSNNPFREIKNKIRRLEIEHQNIEVDIESLERKIKEKDEKAKLIANPCVPSPVALSAAALASSKKKRETLEEDLSNLKIQYEETSNTLKSMREYMHQLKDDVMFLENEGRACWECVKKSAEKMSLLMKKRSLTPRVGQEI